MEDIKKKIEEIVNKIKSDEGFASSFKSDPIKAVNPYWSTILPLLLLNEMDRSMALMTNIPIEITKAMPPIFLFIYFLIFFISLFSRWFALTTKWGKMKKSSELNILLRRLPLFRI